MNQQSRRYRIRVVALCLFSLTCVAIAMVYHLWLPIPRTISEIAQYTHNVPEYLAIDNDDWWDPDFSSWYRQDAQTIRRYLARLGLGTGLYQYLSELLDRASTQLKDEACSDTDYTVVLHPEDDAHIYIWGSIQGSLHALARTLLRLREQGVLSENLALLREHDYFIFNGDVISRSAYSLETLAIVVQLIVQNPGRVFYLRGRQETDSYWHNFGIKRELRYALQETNINNITIAQQLDSFFALLPVAFVIDDMTQHNNRYILIQSGFNGEHYSDVLRSLYCVPAHTEEQLVSCCMSPTQQTDEHHMFSTIIRSHVAAPLPSTGVGVTPEEPFQEATVFFVLNAHNAAYRALFDIEEDSIAILTKNAETQRWVLQDLRADRHDIIQPFKLHAEYDVESGYKKTVLSALKISAEDPVIIATPLDQHQDLAFASARVAAGAHAAVTLLNQQGGLSGRAVELFLQRNRFDRSRVASMIQHMGDAGVHVIASPLGTDLLSMLLQERGGQDIPILLPIAVPDVFRNSDILFYRPSYARQADALISYLITAENAQAFTLVYANDELGMSATKAAQAVLKERNIEAVSLIRYEAQGPDFKAHIETIRAAEQDVICFFGQPSAAMTLIRQVGVQSVVFDTLAGISDLNTPEMIEFLRTKGLRMIVSNVVPNPVASDATLAQSFRTYAQTQSVEMDVMSFEGFINIMLSAELMKKAQKNSSHARTPDLSTDLLGIQLQTNGTQSMHQVVWISTLPEQQSQMWHRIDD